MKIIKNTNITTTKDAKGNTLSTYVTFEDGTTKRLRKRVKEDKITLTIQQWKEMFSKGLNPLETEDKLIFFGLNHRTTLSEAIATYKNEFYGADTSLKAYLYKLQHLVNVYGDTPIEDITKENIEGVIKEKVKDATYGQSTLLQTRKTFSIFFRWCINKKYIDNNPAFGMERIKSEKDVSEVLNPFTEEHFTVIMDKLKSIKNPTLYYFINFIYHACIRPKEIRLLQVKDVDIKAKRIKIRASIAKNNKVDYVPLYPQLIEILTKMGIEEADPEDYLFSIDCKNVSKSIMGKKKSREDFFSDWFRSILKEIDLYDGTGYSIYCFKHTSNIHKIDNGWKTSQLQKLNRHSSIDQTLTYLSKIRKVTEIDNLEIRSI